ncbi:non-hydrolyzing UDP-N-acetylglucosamine 2-epimerase [Francisella philomiragia]|uniref:non-hydrolyzing UDP-N-acetylglucosamine 2-epimerase n=1 Tax=Francisella philomiragia TaxID=28110 RepID=UPI0001AF77AF|nr:UDP-N-acetylglucosamine 2-epimerase (non-hydrolyzing) [Francisella philomiragia]MBK2238193.1 UDP-N-acetylglucosamine 2-epimerase (non-hydrolyzing) [Francisella philomiragia]
MKGKVLLVFGTRPEAIKMLPLVKEFEKHTSVVEMKVCVTGQHRQMLDQILNLFEVVPDYDLNVMKPGQDLYDVTTKILLGMRDVLIDYKPDIVLVHGDTTTTLATSLACFYQQIKVGHVEAGLRTGNLYSPWPEEANRLLTTQISKFHFAPTEKNKENLIKEHIMDNKILVTGNTVIDALFMVLDQIKSKPGLEQQVADFIVSEGYKLSDRRIVLVTGHRRENHGEGMLNICKALKTLAQSYPDVDFVYPVHLNPNVQKPVQDLLSDIDNVFLIKPLDYLPFVYLLSKCYLVLTDSGGIQEEAPSLGKPVLVMRDTTERPEAVDAGTIMLVGAETASIVANVSRLLDHETHYNKMAYAHNPYGDGNASLKIVHFIESWITKIKG